MNEFITSFTNQQKTFRVIRCVGETNVNTYKKMISYVLEQRSKDALGTEIWVKVSDDILANNSYGKLLVEDLLLKLKSATTGTIIDSILDVEKIGV